MIVNPGNGDPQVEFVPNEICVLVTSTDDHAVVVPDLYRRVLDELQQEIRGLSAADPRGLAQQAAETLKAPPGLQDDLARELLPTAFRRTLFTDFSRLELAPLSQARSAGLIEQWVPAAVPLPRYAAEGGPRAAALYFYRFGPDQDLPDVSRDALDTARGLVNVLDLVIRPRISERFAAQRAELTAVGHNWLIAAAQHTSGSPGSKPKPVRPGPGPGRWTFQPHLPPDVPPPGQGQEPIVVAILDTSPTAEEVNIAIGRCQDNTLLAEMGGVVDETIGISADYLERYKPNGPDPAASSKIADHGLFVAGIVRDIAPRAEIHLIRALNDYGTGDMLAITGLLSTLPERFLYANGQPNDRRLVVNLSLGADILPGKAFVEHYFPQMYQKLNQDRMFSGQPDLQRALEVTFPDFWLYLKRLHAGLERALAGGGRRMLVVAATGNDRHRLTPGGFPPEPRWPARYDGVLAVAAVKRERAPADFSNRGDVTEFYNGVATFGGNADNQGEIADEPNPDKVDAVRGLYIRRLPAEETDDEYRDRACWALWSGTSFAAPIITGIVARIWDAARGRRPPRLIQEVVALATDNSTQGPDKLDCSTIGVAQDFVP